MFRWWFDFCCRCECVLFSWRMSEIYSNLVAYYWIIVNSSTLFLCHRTSNTFIIMHIYAIFIMKKKRSSALIILLRYFLHSYTHEFHRCRLLPVFCQPRSPFECLNGIVRPERCSHKCSPDYFSAFSLCRVVVFHQSQMLLSFPSVPTIPPLLLQHAKERERWGRQWQRKFTRIIKFYV